MQGTETYYHVATPEWQPGQDLTSSGPDDRISLFADLEEAVEQAGEHGGLALEVRLDLSAVVKDPVGRGHPYAAERIPARRVGVLGR